MIRENKVYSDRIFAILIVFYGLILFFIPELFINKFDENSYSVLVRERALVAFAFGIIIWKISDFSISIYLKISNILSLIIFVFIMFDPINKHFLFSYQLIAYNATLVFVILLIQFDKIRNDFK
jgi:hypothetical protein